MSDKHTDAQGELVKAAEQFERFFALTDRLDVAYIADSLRATAGVPTKHDGFDPDRATEGQAHTSAATCKECGGAGVVDDGEIDCWPNGMPYENGPVKCVKDCPQCTARAAQLADSTAPGAPFAWVTSDRKHIVFADRVSGDEAAKGMSPLYFAAPTAQQSLTAGGAVPDERELFEALTLEKYAAATFERFTYGKYKTTWVQDHYEGWCMARAAAPLTQVQSEAPNEASIECWSADQEDFNATELDSVLTAHENLRPGDTVWVGEAIRPEPSQLIDADDILTTMGERAYDIAGEHAEDYPDVSKEAEQELNALLAAWIGKHASPSFWTVSGATPYVLTDDDFATDQQPVTEAKRETPSGALADNSK